MVCFVNLTSCGPRNWGSKTVAIVGGGPSLRGFDLNRLRDRFTVLAVNASMFDMPFADAGFSIDLRAIRMWWPRLIALPFDQFYAVDRHWVHGVKQNPSLRMRFVRRQQGSDLSADSSIITAGGTSGFGALNFAYLRGAKKIVLFGFDYGGSGGVWHHNEQHYNFAQRQEADLWAQWARNFERPAQFLRRVGVDVINASPDSAITAFPKCSIEDALTWSS